MSHSKKLTMTWFLCLVVCSSLAAECQDSPRPTAKQTAKATAANTSSDNRRDIVIAVNAAAQKDCGCGACAAKGCEPCHGKNCYFCVAKALVATDCGCKGCADKGCSMCGPGCDVCKFHLAPVAAAKKGKQKQKN